MAAAAFSLLTPAETGWTLAGSRNVLVRPSNSDAWCEEAGMIYRLVVALLAVVYAPVARAEILPGDTSTGSKPVEAAAAQLAGAIGANDRERFLRPPVGEPADGVSAAPIRDVLGHVGTGRVAMP